MDAARLKTDACARAELVVRDVQENWDGDSVANIAIVEKAVRHRAIMRGFYDERTVELAFMHLTGEELV